MQLLIFQFEEESNFDSLTSINIDGNAWFVANEVCKLLDLKNTGQAVSRLENYERSTIIINDGTSGNPNKIIISESGLYSLVFTSKKPFAKKFKKWITEEVIPAIRKTGAYNINRQEISNFVVRFNDNWDRTEKGYFSVISELFIRLYGRFEMIGYKIPNKAFDGKEIRPDVSVGKLFAAYLKKHYPKHQNEYKEYEHQFPSGVLVPARQYKNSILPWFRPLLFGL